MLNFLNYRRFWSNKCLFGVQIQYDSLSYTDMSNKQFLISNGLK